MCQRMKSISFRFIKKGLKKCLTFASVSKIKELLILPTLVRVYGSELRFIVAVVNLP